MAIKENSAVEITSSHDLNELKLDGLVGRLGMITEDLTDSNRKNRGYMVRLAEGDFLGENEWFVPVQSVREYKV